jgi:hypothetical protein
MKRRNKQPSIKKAFSRCGGLLLMSFTMAIAVGARTGAQHEVEASAVLESPEMVSTIVEASPTPTSTPTPSPTSAQVMPAPVATDPESGEGKIEEMIREHFGEHAEDAFKILECENKTWNPKAVNHNRNGTQDLGLFQLNNAYWGGEENFDPETNIKKARMIFDRAGERWTPWTCAYMAGQKSYLHQ